MKIKPKDIFVLIFCSLLIGGSVFYILKQMSPKDNKKQTIEEAAKKDIPAPLDDNFDEKTLDKVRSLTDYGKPALENIGKTSPFSPVE